jgi:hypothetical protein
MLAKKNNKGVVFTIMSIFLSILLFAFASFYLKTDTFTITSDFTEARIFYLDNEIDYFVESYLKDVYSYSLYRASHTIIQENQIIRNLNFNHSLLNFLYLEAMRNGTFNSISYPNLNYNDSVMNLVQIYNEDFNENSRANITFQINRINIYDSDPFYVTFQIESSINVSTFDNIASWNMDKTHFIVLSVFNLNDPEFRIHLDENYSIEPINFFGAGNNWSMDMFNDTIINVYSTVFMEKDYKYTLGESFLNRLLNRSVSVYDDSVLSLSFDHDLEYNYVYDNSLNNNASYHFGNTRLFLSFEENSVNLSSNEIFDLSAYNNDGSFIISNYSDVNCKLGFCFTLNGSSDGILIDDDNGDMNMSSNFSFSIWIWPDNISLQNFNSNILNFGMNEPVSTGGYLLRYNNNDSNLLFLVGNGSHSESITSLEVINGSWNHFVGTYNSSHLSFYQNSRLIERKRTAFSKLIYDNSRLSIGYREDLSSNYFTGIIDNVGIYSRVLSDNKINTLYTTSENINFIDYVDGLYGKAIEFDGIDDYIEVNFSDKFDTFTAGDLSFETWIKTYKNEGNIFVYEGELTMGVGNNDFIFFRDNHGNGVYNDTFSFPIGEYIYLVGVYDSSSSLASLYANGELIERTMETDTGTPGVWNPELDGGIFSIGSGTYPNVGPTGIFFEGEIDEIKIYNRTFSDDEVKSRYLNYKSLGKGCCNYFTMINPNLMGFNTSDFEDNELSYSSRIFFNNISRNNPIGNITLFNVTNITSSVIENNFYEFKVDSCMYINIFSIPDYYIGSGFQNIERVGRDGTECKFLIREGIY